MGALAINRNYTIEEYLDIEDDSEVRYEYHDGEIFMMAGAMPAHSLISANLSRAIGNALGNKNCMPMDGSLRVYVESINKIVHPDISVICGSIETDATRKSLVKNPILIIEVLSESTEAYDRGDKFAIYRQIPSFKEYILVSQREAVVESFYREDKIRWHINRVEGLDTEIEVKSLDITLSLSDIYRMVVFEPIESKFPEFEDM